ncbi:MAG: zinc ribbon domain-containing protein [Candidatus Hodarchaeales archaeon]|jgi:hypothetical protein
MNDNLPPEDSENSNNIISHVECPVCQHMNPSPNQSCDNCNASLIRSNRSTENKFYKTCPKCNNRFPETVNFCFFDGSKLLQSETKQGPQQIRSKSSQSQSIPQFSGFEVPIKAQHSPIPLDLIRTTTSLLIPSPKAPVRVKNVKTSFWSIPAPKKEKNWITKWFNHVGFSRINIMAYLICVFYVGIIYGLWFYRDFETLSFNNEWVELGTLAFLSIFIASLMLVLPVITLGYSATKVVQSDRTDYQFRIEPTLLIITLVLNFIMYQVAFQFPFPILLLCGQIKMRGLPPKNEISKAITKGVIPSIVLAYFFIVLYFITTIDQWTDFQPIFNTVNPLITINFKILAIFGTGISFLVMLPFGNALGKLIQERSLKTYYFMFFLTVILLFLMFLIVQEPSGT